MVDAAIDGRSLHSASAESSTLVPSFDLHRDVVEWLVGAHRLGLSFWDDEVYAMRRAIHGRWAEKDDGVKFRPVKWQETLWFFEKPQHVLHSVITRVVLNTWQTIARPSGLRFREDVVRFPSYLAGILSVGALALLLWRLRFPAAGVMAAFLLAMHPWHLRYASELRAYSLMLFLLPLTYFALMEALNDGRWRWWIAYGAGLFLLMYANALNIYPAIGLGLCGLGAVAMQLRDRRAPVQIARFVVVTLLAGMAFFQLMLPCAPQFAAYLREGAVQTPMELGWLENFLSLLLAGLPWNSSGQPVSSYLELFPWVVLHPALFIGIVATTFFLFVIGARRLSVSGSLQSLIVLTLLLPAPVAYVISRLRGQHLFEWYLIFLLPGAVACVALGADAWREALGKSRVRQVIGILLMAGLLSGYFIFTNRQRTWLLTRPLEQIRESVLLTRPSLDPLDPANRNILTACPIGPPDPYDPAIRRFDSVKSLRALMVQADTTHKTLFVNLGFPATAQSRYPGLMHLLEHDAFFEKTARLEGLEPINDRLIYRYKPGSQAGHHLEQEFPEAP